MKNTLKIDRENKLIIMDRTFSKLSENTRSEEYAHLQLVRKDYPTYEVVTKSIKRNKDKETYKGLTYAYMRDYIILNETDETRTEVMAEFSNLLHISRCHAQAKRYPVVKSWFLAKYPEIVEFGVKNLAS